MAWGPVFRRNFIEVGEGQFQSMLALLSGVYISECAMDSHRRVWTGMTTGCFSLLLHFSVLNIMKDHQTFSLFLPFGRLQLICEF